MFYWYHSPSDPRENRGDEPGIKSSTEFRSGHGVLFDDMEFRTDVNRM